MAPNPATGSQKVRPKQLVLQRGARLGFVWQPGQLALDHMACQHAASWQQRLNALAKLPGPWQLAWILAGPPQVVQSSRMLLPPPATAVWVSGLVQTVPYTDFFVYYFHVFITAPVNAWCRLWSTAQGAGPTRV